MYPKIASQIKGEFASTVKIETAENVFEIVEVDTSSTKTFGIVTPSTMTLEAYNESGLADSFPDITLASLFENLGANFSALSTNLS